MNLTRERLYRDFYKKVFDMEEQKAKKRKGQFLRIVRGGTLVLVTVILSVLYAWLLFEIGLYMVELKMAGLV